MLAFQLVHRSSITACARRVRAALANPVANECPVEPEAPMALSRTVPMLLLVLFCASCAKVRWSETAKVSYPCTARLLASNLHHPCADEESSDEPMDSVPSFGDASTVSEFFVGCADKGATRR
jgi:hypothetical protein